MTKAATLKIFSSSTIVALVAVASAPAFAHHPLGGEKMTTVAQGVLSGLAHPVIEFDHLVFLVAFGLLLVGQSRIVFMASVFIGCSMIGVVGRYHLGAPNDLEMVIAASVVAAGLLLWTKSTWRHQVVQAALIAGLAFAGLAHGLAFGESIIGSETTILGGYLLGLALIQLALVVCVSTIGRAFFKFGLPGDLRLRTAGALVAAFGTLQLGRLLFAA